MCVYLDNYINKNCKKKIFKKIKRDFGIFLKVYTFTQKITDTYTYIQTYKIRERHVM